MANPRPLRNPALDFTKGALVLFMVLYHWLNYFISADGDFYRYIRFVTPSFIFITGFVISNVYLAKYELSDSRLPKRLLQRGLKILAIFVVLNIVISLLLSRSHDGRTLFSLFSASNLFAIYVTGNTVIAGGGKLAAFYVLVPISYLLVLSAGLLILFQLRLPGRVRVVLGQHHCPRFGGVQERESRASNDRTPGSTVRVYSHRAHQPLREAPLPARGCLSGLPDRDHVLECRVPYPGCGCLPKRHAHLSGGVKGRRARERTKACEFAWLIFALWIHHPDRYIANPLPRSSSCQSGNGSANSILFRRLRTDNDQCGSRGSLESQVDRSRQIAQGGFCLS